MRCNHEVRNMLNTSMTKSDVGSLLTFEDEKFSTEIDQLCPTLSLALRGALGVLNEDSKEARICRSTIYGTIFKIRY